MCLEEWIFGSNMFHFNFFLHVFVSGSREMRVAESCRTAGAPLYHVAPERKCSLFLKRIGLLCLYVASFCVLVFYYVLLYLDAYRI